MAATDRERQLTSRGEDDLGFGCQQFHQHCEERGIRHPDHILHSPWERTTQTAGIVAAAFTHAELVASTALKPGADIPDVDRLLDGLLTDFGAEGSQQHHVALVSHQPLVSRLIDYYLDSPGQVPPLTPGALAVLSLDVAGRGTAQLLFWSMPPQYEEMR